MPKIIVEKSIKIGGDDINEWAEPTRSNETRSFVDFSNKNGKVYISKEGYNKKYVTVYNSKKINKITGISSDNYQSNHSRYFGKIGNEHIWITERGCAPIFNKMTNIVSASMSSKFVFSLQGNYTKIEPSIKSFLIDKSIDKSKNIKYSLIDKKCFYILLQGAGSSGQCGITHDKWLISNEDIQTFGGTGGGYVLVRIDMTKLANNSLSLILGKGKESYYPKDGKSGKAERFNIAGEPSYIKVNGTNVVTLTVTGKGVAGGYNIYTAIIDEINKQPNSSISATLKDLLKTIDEEYGVNKLGTFLTNISGINIIESHLISTWRDEGVKLSVDSDYNDSNKLSFEFKSGNLGAGGAIGGGASCFYSGPNAPEGYRVDGISGNVGCGGSAGTAPHAGDGTGWSGYFHTKGGKGGDAGFQLFY